VEPIDPAVRGVRAKLARALHHLEALYTDISTFTERHPATLGSPHQVSDEVWVYHAVLSQPYPIEWSVRLGEAVHDLRSALDNTVSVMTAARGGDVNTSAFPVYDSADKFQRHGSRKIAALPEEARAFIEGLQPYASESVIPHYLHSLEEMWNADKHRLMQPWGLQLGERDVRFTVDPETVVIVGELWAPRVIQNGAPALLLRFSGRPTKVQMEGDVAFGVAIETPDDPEGEYGGTLFSLYDGVVSVVHALLAMMDGFPAHPPY
jgi:hypothetical protein